MSQESKVKGHRSLLIGSLVIGSLVIGSLLIGSLVIGSLVIGLLAASVGAQGSQVKVSARVDKSRLSIHEELVLTVTVSGDALLAIEEPQLPQMRHFVVTSQSYSTRTEIVNFTVRTIADYTYSLRPTRTGKLTIGSVNVRVGGKAYRTKPITVTVLTGSVLGSAGSPRPTTPPSPSLLPRLPSFPSSPGESIFVKASTDRTTVYIGEQVTYTFAFYSSVFSAAFAENPRYTPPHASGFLQYALPDEPPSRQVIGGELYEVEKIRTAFFPVKPGKLQIGAAKVEVKTSLFDEPQIYASRPITINVMPLPSAGKPRDFGGAVGSFRLDAALDRHRLRVGEAATLKVRVSGQGNIKWIKRPPLPPLNGVQVHPAGEHERISVKRNSLRLAGEKVFTYLLVPTRPNVHTIPPLRLSFFEPSQRSYRVVFSRQLTFSATGDTRTLPLATPSVPSVKSSTPVLRDIKPSGFGLLHSEAPLYLNPVFIAVNALPLLVVVGAVVCRRRREQLLADVALLREREALRRAQKWLREAPKMLRGGQTDAFCAQLSEVLTECVAARLGVSASSVSSESIEPLMIEGGASPEIAKAAREVLCVCERARFAPAPLGTDESHETLRRAEQIFKAMQKQKGWGRNAR